MVEISHHFLGTVLHTVQSESLQGADLRGRNLWGADLRQANLRDADLRGANLGGALLARADLTGAVYDHRTVWPVGFNPRAHGAQLGW